MKNYTLEIEIDLPLEKVGELYGDPANLPFWQPGFISIEPVEGEAKKFKLLYLHGKRTIEMVETVEVDELPNEYTASYAAKGMQMRVSNRFEKIDENRTRWISDNESQTSGLFMKLMGILMPGCFKKESYKYLVNFKAFAERGADVRASAAA